MTRKFKCLYKGYEKVFVILPDIWLGLHAQRRDQTLVAAEKYKSQTMTQFAVAMALLEDWNIPGLTGNIEKWDFTKIDLKLITWVIDIVLNDFSLSYNVPKVSYSLQPEGLTARQETMKTSDGD